MSRGGPPPGPAHRARAGRPVSNRRAGGWGQPVGGYRLGILTFLLYNVDVGLRPHAADRVRGRRFKHTKKRVQRRELEIAKSRTQTRLLEVSQMFLQRLELVQDEFCGGVTENANRVK